jgi:hypothetical protein
MYATGHALPTGRRGVATETKRWVAFSGPHYDCAHSARSSMDPDVTAFAVSTVRRVMVLSVATSRPARLNPGGFARDPRLIGPDTPTCGLVKSALPASDVCRQLNRSITR